MSKESSPIFLTRSNIMTELEAYEWREVKKDENISLIMEIL